MSGRKGMVHYRVETKQEAVRLVLEEHLSYAEVAVRLGIRKAARIEAWVHMYRQEGELSFHKRPQYAEHSTSLIASVMFSNEFFEQCLTSLV